MWENDDCTGDYYEVPLPDRPQSQIILDYYFFSNDGFDNDAQAVQIAPGFTIEYFDVFIGETANDAF